MEKQSEENPLFKVQEDGNGMEYKIANVFNPQNVQQSGIVELSIIGRQTRHDPDVSIAKVQDPATGIIYGKVIGVDPKTKEFIYQKITLGIRQTFDLSSVTEREQWMVISRHHLCETCPYPTNQKPLFRVIDRDKEAKAKIIRINYRTRAIDLIGGMENGELVDMAVNMGITSNYNSEITLKAELLSVAERKSEEFCNLYDNANRKLVTVLNRCRTVGLVTLDPNSGFMWKLTIPLGQTEAAAIQYMNKNVGLLQSMDFESKAKSPMFQTFATLEEKQTAIEKSETPQQEERSEFLTNKELNYKMNQLNNAIEEANKSKMAFEKLISEHKKEEEPKAAEMPEEQMRAIAGRKGMKNAYEKGTDEQFVVTKEQLKAFLLEVKKKNADEKAAKVS